MSHTQKNNTQSWKWAASIGVGGSLLMYAGDILLYGTATNADISVEGIIATMNTLPQWRIMLGGFVGPFASLLYCIGFFGLAQGVRPEFRRWKEPLCLLFSLAIIYGGAYHSHFPQTAFMDSPAPLDASLAYLGIMTMGATVPMALASILFIYLGLTGKTIYRKRLLLLSPLPMILFGQVLTLLPPPWLTFFAGGWNNLLFTLFFTASMLPAFRNKGMVASAEH